MNININKDIVAIVAILFIALLPTGIGICGKNDKGEMHFTETIHDFGTIKEKGGPVSVEFPFTNIGHANLVIYDAKADCGCTVPDYPMAPIAPGKSGKINVTYNPLGRPGAFEKVITVRTNGKPGKFRLKIRGTVMPQK